MSLKKITNSNFNSYQRGKIETETSETRDLMR